MENSVSRDYVTEKLWHAYEGGCVPIYYGAPNIAVCGCGWVRVYV